MTNNHKSRKSAALPLALAAGTLLLAGCSNVALIEAPYYDVTEVQSFKVASAPSQIMMLEVVDANALLPEQVWATALSNHGFPPRLTFVTSPDDVADDKILKPENRLVAVVNPSQTSRRDALCQAPQSDKLDDSNADHASDRVIVRFGFCLGGDIISETRARFTRDQFETQLINSAGTLSQQLFPIKLPDEDDNDNCPRLKPC